MSQDLPTGYSLHGYGRMIANEPRMSAYAEALQQAVTPGCTVFDIGAGPGVFSLLACQYGAGRVVAIEPDNSVTLLREFAAANGCLDKVTVFQGLSSDFEPEARADVIISDLRGMLPLYQTHLPAIVDARQRLLAPGGRLIPQRDRLRVALVEHDVSFESFEMPWLRNDFGLDLSLGHRFANNRTMRVDLKSGDLLGDAVDLATIDYLTVEDPNFAGDAELAVGRAGSAHGLVIWFDAELGPGIGFSNAPGQPLLVYGQTLFPFDSAIRVEAGDRVAFHVRADLVGSDYIWTWKGEFRRPAQDHPIARFRQSTFQSRIIAAAALKQRASDFTPLPGWRREADLYCLEQIDGQRTLEEIAALLQQHFGDHFASRQKALDYVAELTARHGEPKGKE